MANQFDNTDPLQLTTEPIQAAVPEAPKPTQNQQVETIQYPQAQAPNDLQVIDYYRSKGLSDSDIVGVMTVDGSRTREDVLGAMNAQYENTQREIREENERLLKQQREAEAKMIERQQKLDDMLKKKESPSLPPSDASTSPTGVPETTASPEIGAILADAKLGEFQDVETRPLGYDTPEMLRMYQDSQGLADMGTEMRTSDAAISAIGVGDNQSLRDIVESDMFDGGDVEVEPGVSLNDLYSGHVNGDQEASDKLKNFFFDRYDQSKAQASLAMQSLQAVNEELGIPWEYNPESDLDMDQAILDSYRIVANGEQSTQQYQDMMNARRMAAYQYDDSADAYGTWITNRAAGASAWMNDIRFALPNRVRGMYFDQIGDSPRARQYKKQADMVSAFNEEIRNERNRRSYNMNDEELQMGLWESVVEAWTGDDVSWGLVGRKAMATFEDVLPDVLVAASTIGVGTAVKGSAQAAIKGLGVSESALKTYLGTGARRSLTAQMAFGEGIASGTAAFFGVRGGSDVYMSVLEDPSMSKGEKLFLSTVVGTAEAVLGRLLSGAERAIAEGLSARALSGQLTSAGRRKAIKDAMRGVTKRQLYLNGAKQAGAEWIEEAGIEAIDQGMRVILDKMNGRKTSGFDFYSIMDAGLAGLLGTGPLTTMSSMSASMAHSKVAKSRYELVKHLAELDRLAATDLSPEVKSYINQQRDQAQQYMAQLDGMSEREYSKLTDSEKRTLNNIHRSMAMTRDEHRQERNSDAKKALEDKYEALAKQKKKIEDDAADRAPQPQTPPVPNAEGDMVATEERDVTQQTEAEHAQMPEQEDVTEVDIVPELDKKIDSHLKAHLTATEKTSSDPDGSTKHARTAKGQRTRARNLLMHEGMTRDEAEAEINRRLEGMQGKSFGSVSIPIDGTSDYNAEWVGNGEGQVPIEVVAQIDRMKRAFGKVLNDMGVNVTVHRDRESFEQATGLENSLGVYDPNTRTIHLAPGAGKLDVMEEFGHAAFRSILKSDSRLGKRLYKDIAKEAGIDVDPKTGMAILPENWRKSAELERRGKENPFAMAIFTTEALYPDYDPVRRREETILEAVREYAKNPNAFIVRSRVNRNLSRVDMLKNLVNKVLVRAGFKGNFISDEEVDFFKFAQKFRLATEGIETDVTVDPKDYSQQTPVEDSKPKRETQKKAKKNREVIRAREGESNEAAVKRMREEQRRREEQSALGSFEAEIGGIDPDFEMDMFESRKGSAFDYLRDTEVFYTSAPPMSTGMVNRPTRKKSIIFKDYMHFRNWYNFMTRNQTDNNVYKMYYIEDGVKKTVKPPKKKIDPKTGEPAFISGPETWVQRQVRKNTEALEARRKALRQQDLKDIDELESGESLGDADVRLESREGSVFDASEQLAVHLENVGSTFTFDGINQVGRPMSAVSIFPERSQIVKGQITEDDINKFIANNQDLITGNQDVLAMGTWFEESENQTYLDLSSVLPHDEAKRLGRDYNQKAVFNLEILQEVDTGGTGAALPNLKPEIERINDIRSILGQPLEARAGGVFDTVDIAEAKRRGLPLDNMESVNGSQIRMYGYDRTRPSFQDDEQHEIRSGVTYIFNRRIQTPEGERRLITAHRNTGSAEKELNALKRLAKNDAKSGAPKGYITVGFSLNGEQSTNGNPDVYSYIIKRLRSAYEGQELIDQTNKRVNGIVRSNRAKVIARIQKAATEDGRQSLAEMFGDEGISIKTDEQAKFVLDFLEDKKSPLAFPERVASSTAFTKDGVIKRADLFKAVNDPMFDDADLGTIVAFVKVPYKIDGDGNVTGFSVAKAEGDPFEGAIVVDPAVENEFEGHRIAERQYVIEDIIPDYSLSMGTIEGDEIDPATGRPVRIPARRRRLSSAVKKAQAAIEEGKEPGAYEAKIRSKVRGQASDSVFKGVVNIDYGNAEADANDIYMTSRGPVSKPLLGVRAAEQQQLESRTGSVFESRQADEAPLTRPEGQFELREMTPFQTFKNLAIKRLQDKYVDILSIQEDVEAFLGRPVEESKDFRMKEELMYGKAANDLAKLNEKVDNLTATMNRLGVSTGDLTDYMYALHAPERNALILKRDGVEDGSGMSTEEAARIYALFEDAGKIDALNEALAVVREIQQDTRDTMVKFGLETQETIDAWERIFENYVPLAGLATDENSASTTQYPHGGAGLQVKGPMTKTAKGRKTKADNLIAQVVAQNSAVKIQARKNEVLMSIHDLIKDNPNPKVWGITTIDQGEGSVPMRVNGQKTFLNFNDASYAKSLKDMSIARSNALAKLLRPLNSWLRRSFTTLNPEFFVANFLRDIQTAMFHAASEAEIEGGEIMGARVMADMYKNVGPTLKALLNETNPKTLGKLFAENPMLAKYYQEFKDDGGQTGWAYQKTLEQIASELEKETGNTTKAQEFIAKTRENTVGFIEGINDAFENSIRLSSYIAARDAGVSRAKAAQFAKNITVNFNKQGEWGQVANSVYLFFNASIQGTARLGKAMLSSKPPKAPDGSQRNWAQRRTTAQVMAAGLTTLSAMLASLGRAMSEEDKDGVLYWDKIPDYVKERNLVIMWNGKNYIKIPMPYGYNLFANVGTAAVDVSGGGKEIDEALLFLGQSFMSSFSPISFGQSKDLYTYATKAVVPTAFKPFVDIATNETYFGGRVYAEQSPFGAPKPESSMSFKSPEMVRDFFKLMNEATGGSDQVSGGLDFNPDKTWHLIDYFIGGAGQFVERTTGTAYTLGQKIANDADIKFEFNDVPLLRQIYGEPAKFIDYAAYRERTNEIAQLVREAKDPSARRDDRERYAGLRGLYNASKATEKKLKRVREARKEARKIKGYAERAVRMQELQDMELMLIMRFNKYYDEIRK